MQCTASKLMQRAALSGASYHTGSDVGIQNTRILLSQFKGGCVKLSKNDKTGIAALCLDRPEKKNAISGQLLLELESATEELEKWKEGKGLILYGSKNMFSSGGDLNMSKATCTAEEGYAISHFVQDLTTRLRTLPLLSVALIEGVALGGGAELAVASCDLRIMTPDAKIGFVHGRMGLTPGWGGGVALKQLLGPCKALELIISGRLVTAQEAISIGLANDIISNISSVEETENWLGQKVQNTAIDIIRASKILMTSQSYQEELELERRLHAPLWGGKAKLEALAKHIKHK